MKGEDDFMKPIELHIRGGGLVVALDPQQDSAIYMMNPMPEILFWGTRIFYRTTDILYEECYAVTVFTKA